MPSAINYLTPAATYSTQAEPVLSDFDFVDFDLDFDLDFDSDFETCSPCLEEDNIAPTPPCEKAPIVPTSPHETAPVAPTPPRETCVPTVPLTQVHQPTQPKQRKAETRQPRYRKRPYKNIREKRRRASIKSKLTKLHAVCISDAITAIVPRPQVKELIIPFEGSDIAGTPKPCQMDILCDSIGILEAMDKELIKLRARNKELNKEKCSI